MKARSVTLVVQLVVLFLWAAGYVYLALASAHGWTVPDIIVNDQPKLLIVVLALAAPSPQLQGTSSVETKQLVSAATSTPVDLSTDPAVGH